MAKKDFTTPLTLNGDYPNLDDRYTNNGDPYTSVSAAQTALASKLNAYYIGLTVLVKESGWTEAKEYWVQPVIENGETNYRLVKKGSSDYTDLSNKPAINGVQLSGDKTPAQLGLATANQVETLSDKVDKLPTGYYYGKFDSVEDLPEATEKGYAYVASSDPTVFYTYLVSGAGAEWVDSGNKMVNTVDLTTPKTTETELSKGEKYFASANVNDRPADVVAETGVVKSLGYRILSPNLSFAEQVNSANTIYEIKDEFDFGGGGVTIPANCTLKFNGGRVKNGIIVGNLTKIISDNQAFDDIELRNFDTVEWKWFCYDDTNSDNSVPFDNFVKSINSNSSTNVVIHKGVYNIGNHTQSITKNCNIDGRNASFIINNKAFTVSGENTDLTVVEDSLDKSTIKAGNNQITVEFEEELTAGDIVSIVDSRNYSGNLARYYLYKGEYVTVKSVSNGVITLVNPIIEIYDTDANLQFKRIRPIVVNINNLNVNYVTEKQQPAIRLEYLIDSYFSNLTASGSRDTLISAYAIFNSHIINPILIYKSEQLVGLNYGIVAQCVQNLFIANGNLKTSRHSIAVSSTGFVPSRGVYIDNCTIGTFGASFSMDSHANNYDIVCTNCVITGGSTLEGENIKFINCQISNEDRPTGYILYYIYNNVDFINCNFISYKNTSNPETPDRGSAIGTFFTPFVYKRKKAFFSNCNFTMYGGYFNDWVFTSNIFNQKGSAWTRTYKINEGEDNEETITETVYTVDDNNASADRPISRMPLYNESEVVGYVDSVNEGYSSIIFDGKTYIRTSSNDKTLNPSENGDGLDIILSKCTIDCKINRPQVSFGRYNNVNITDCIFNRCVLIRGYNKVFSLIGNTFINTGTTLGFGLGLEYGIVEIINNLYINILSILYVVGERTVKNITIKGNKVMSVDSGYNYPLIGLGTLTITSGKLLVEDNIIVNSSKNVSFIFPNIEVHQKNNLNLDNNITLSVIGGYPPIGSQTFINGIPYWYDGVAWKNADGVYQDFDKGIIVSDSSSGTKTLNVLNSKSIQSFNIDYNTPYVYRKKGKKIDAFGNEVNSGNTYQTTNFILVRGFEKIKVQFFNRVPGADVAGYAFYDENGNKVARALYTFDLDSGMYEYADYTLDVPATAYYLRYTLYSSSQSILIEYINPTTDAWLSAVNNVSSIATIFTENTGVERKADIHIKLVDDTADYIITAKQEAATISTDVNTLTFGATEQSAKDVVVTTDSKKLFYAKVSASWITATISNKTVSINVADNTGEERTGKVTIVDMDSKVIEVSVTQSRIN